MSRLTDEQRRQIFALKGKMSARACAKEVGTTGRTVSTLWGMGGGVKNPTHTREKKGKTEDVKLQTSQTNGVNFTTSQSLPSPGTIEVCDYYCKAENIRAEMVANLYLTKGALQKALKTLEEEPNSDEHVRTVAQISKTVQNAIEDLAKWIGLDKATHEEAKKVNADEMSVEDAVELLKAIEG